MRLSELIQHTSDWTGIPLPHVRTVARVLQPAGLISSAGRNPRGAETTVDDKINLLMGVCGVEVANRAADHVRIWRRLLRWLEKSEHNFAFLRSETIRDFFFDLITKDLNGGALDAWLKEADDAYDRVPGLTAAPRHRITLDFYVDEFSLTLAVSRFVSDFSHLSPTLRQSSADTIEVKFIQPPPGAEHGFEQPRREQGYLAPSQLIRRLHADNLRGWGTCLVEASA
jgi:hypothetical protein